MIIANSASGEGAIELRVRLIRTLGEAGYSDGVNCADDEDN